MKILLIQAPFYVTEDQRIFHYAHASSEPTLGLGDLAAYLIAHGYKDVEIKNFCLDAWDVVTEYLKKYESFGKNLIVGINCFSDTRQSTFKVSQIAKQIIPRCTTVIGGVHASILFEPILKNNPSIDAVVVGEGETSLLEIVRRTQQGEPLSEDILGIAFRKNAEIVFTGNPDLIKNLDDLPMTAHQLYDIEALRWNRDFNPLRNMMMGFIPKSARYTPKIWYMNTSRGCPGNCQFCTGNKIWQGRWRAKSPTLVVDEMEKLHKRFGVNVISFFDNCFVANRKRVKEICEEILARGLNMHWSCLTRVDNIGDSEILSIMRKAGCIGICFGIESGSPAILQIINKKCDVAQAKRAVQLTKKAGIKALTFYIVGNYGETDQTIGETIDFIKAVKADIISIEYNVVFPGTDLYAKAKSNGWISDTYWDGYGFAPHFTYQHSFKKLTSYVVEMFFAHYSSRLASGDFSSLRRYFFTRSFLGYVTYRLKVQVLIDFIKRLLKKNDTIPTE